MAARAFLFDLDGTLWRGHEWYASVLSEVIGVDEAKTMERLAAGENLFRLAGKAGLSRSQLITACRSRVNSLMIYERVLPSLQQLSEVGCKLGVVTSLSERIAGPALAKLGLDRFFKVKEFAARKPSPSPLLAALAALGEVADTRHYYVGDTSNDALCAARAGVTFAWASYGYGMVEPTSQIRVLRRFADVVAL